MMEVARVLGARLRTGWRPRRTIMFLRYCTVLYVLLYITVLYVCTAVLFCTIIILSWGAEEYSLCGSREFVEQYEMEVSERSVSFQ